MVFISTCVHNTHDDGSTFASHRPPASQSQHTVVAVTIILNYLIADTQGAKQNT